VGKSAQQKNRTKTEPTNKNRKMNKLYALIAITVTIAINVLIDVII